MRRSSYAILWAILSMLVLGSLYWGLRTSLRWHEVSAPEPRTYRLSISAARPGVHEYNEKISTLKPGGEVRLTFAVKDAGAFLCTCTIPTARCAIWQR